MKRKLLLAIALALNFISPRIVAGSASPPADWFEWQMKRRESVAGTNGWTTLVGLHWLREGTNFAGADPTNQAVLPAGRAAGNIGVFVRTGQKVRFESAPGVRAFLEARAIRSVDLESDALHEPPKLYVGPLSIVVVERGERVGLRVRDPESPARRAFPGFTYFPYDPKWRIEGRYEPLDKPVTMKIPDVTGSSVEMPCPGSIVFRFGGKMHRLKVLEEPDEPRLFVIFRDRSANSTTYHSGRFFYVSRPDASGRVTIDFNQAYNPPCAYTPFAICPIPPRENWLPFSVNAGERKPVGRH